jgi:putative toxin-antitoxin system antitoxin component (TIGR02293 family)
LDEVAICRIIHGIMPHQHSATTGPVWVHALKLLGVDEPVSSEIELARLVQHGLPASSVERLVSLGFQRREVFRLVIPQRTLTHRKQRRQALTGDESDKAVRLARVRALAARVFGNEDKAWRWLRKQKRAFDGQAPIDLLATESGARAVEEELHRIDEGMFV